MRTLIGLFILFFTTYAYSNIIITEVSNNPIGNSTSIPGDLSHEYIEVYNSGSLPVNLLGYYIKTSSAGSTAEPDSNNLQVFSGDSLCDIGKDSALLYDSILKPGAYGIILGRKYVSAPESTWYDFPSGTTIFATRKTYLKSGGLSNSSAIVELYSGEGVRTSIFNGFGSKSVDPGEGFTWQRVQYDSSDSPLNWKIAGPTPGQAYPYLTARQYGKSLALSEFLCDPAAGGAEWVELYNFGSDTVNILGWSIRTGDVSGIISFSSIFIPPARYLLICQPGIISDPLLKSVLCPVIVPSAWGGLSRNGDVIAIRDESGIVIDSLCYSDNEYNIEKGISYERKSFGSSSLILGNWKLSSDQIGATPGFTNSALISELDFSFSIGNRRIVYGCDGLEFINMYLNVPSKGELTLKVFDLKGRLIKTIYNKTENISAKFNLWDGTDVNNRKLKSGVYIIYSEFSDGISKIIKKVPVIIGGECND